MNHPNNKCFKIEKIIYKNAIFNKSIDATYIMHLENNGRIYDIKKQLNKIKPTNIIYIVYNKGFQNCEKILPHYSPQYDIVDTYLYIFKDANAKKYKNILILEDDFIFSNEIYKDNHIYNINNFLIEKKDEKMLYFLGCLSWLQIPYNSHTNINLLSSGAHAVVYTYKTRNEFLKPKLIPIFDWDVYHNLFAGIRKYVYYKPLCYQLFPETENSKYWVSLNGLDITKIYIKQYNLDVNLEPGYSNTYYYSLIFGYILICISIIFIFLISYYVIYKNINFIKKNSKKIKKEMSKA
jgi:hypothetical protein